MNITELRDKCANALSQPGVCGVILTVPKGGRPKGFPRGELLNEMERGGVIERTYNFDPLKILAWLDKHFTKENL